MTTYVMRDGKLVVKGPLGGRETSPNGPYVSRFDPMESPVTGETITSWRQRDADMKAVNAFDGRDLPKDYVHPRGIDAWNKEQADAARRREPDQPFWRDK